MNAFNLSPNPKFTHGDVVLVPHRAAKGTIRYIKRESKASQWEYALTCSTGADGRYWFVESELILESEYKKPTPPQPARKLLPERTLVSGHGDWYAWLYPDSSSIYSDNMGTYFAHGKNRCVVEDSEQPHKVARFKTPKDAAMALDELGMGPCSLPENKPIESQAAKDPHASSIHTFASGATRSTETDDTPYELITPIGLRRVAKCYAEGEKKYGRYSCEKGIPISNLIRHSTAHTQKYLSGDRSEDHLAKAAWGFLMACHCEEMTPEINTDLRPERKDI